MPHMQIVSIAKCELSSNKLHELKLAKCVNVNSNEKKRGLKGNIAFYKQRIYVFNGNGVGIIPGVKLLLLRSICGIIYMKKNPNLCTGWAEDICATMCWVHRQCERLNMKFILVVNVNIIWVVNDCFNRDQADKTTGLTHFKINCAEKRIDLLHRTFCVCVCWWMIASSCTQKHNFCFQKIQTTASFVDVVRGKKNCVRKEEGKKVTNCIFNKSIWIQFACHMPRCVLRRTVTS